MGLFYPQHGYPEVATGMGRDHRFQSDVQGYSSLTVNIHECIYTTHFRRLNGYCIAADNTVPNYTVLKWYSSLCYWNYSIPVAKSEHVRAICATNCLVWSGYLRFSRSLHILVRVLWRWDTDIQSMLFCRRWSENNVVFYKKLVCPLHKEHLFHLLSVLHHWFS